MSEMQDTTDWKKIALALAQRVNFAVTNCKSSGGLLNSDTGVITPWRDYMVEALELIPGCVVDREVLATLDMPPAQRRKALAQMRARKKAAQKGGAS